METALNNFSETGGNQSQEVVVTPDRDVLSLGLKELWAFRGLVYFLAARDIKVRYKQTVLGASWAILQPVFTMLVFFVIFSRVAKIPSDNLPYPLFAFCGLVPWTFFANGLNHASQSLVNESNLLKKVYFPRLVVPVSAMLVGSADLVLAFSVLVVMMIWYGAAPSFNAALIVIPLILAFATCLGTGLWLSALNVQFRDIRHVVPFSIQAWMYLTPIAYPASVVPERFRMIYAINPMTSVVEGFRYALLGRGTPFGAETVVSAGMAALLLLSGLLYFRKMEKSFADVV
ncbi:MAG: ABC transporter permease [Deltaproteobacteria bacterium]|nr:ABC transporter permease [Deltaproteobacteria bacterium]